MSATEPNLEFINDQSEMSNGKELRGPNSKKSLLKWTKEEDEKLILLANMVDGKRWKWVAKQLPGKKDSQCRSRWERIRPGMIQGRWTKNEDIIIMDLYKSYGERWSDMARHLNGRTGKQVRDRFKNVLDPSLSKEKFTRQDDEKVYKLYLLLGPNWKQIKKEYFPERTADFIKNRFYSHFRKFQSKFSKNELDDSNLKVDHEKKTQEKSSEISERSKIKIKLNNFSIMKDDTKKLEIAEEKKKIIPFRIIKDTENTAKNPRACGTTNENHAKLENEPSTSYVTNNISNSNFNFSNNNSINAFDNYSAYSALYLNFVNNNSKFIFYFSRL